MQRQRGHHRALVVDRHVVASRQLHQEACAIKRQIEEHHVALADPPCGRASTPRRGTVEAQREVVLVADLQRTPSLVADHDVAVAVLLIDADAQHGAARIAADQEATVAEARVDADLPLPDGPPERRILRERGSDREAIQHARQQQQPTQHSCPHSREHRTQASTGEFYTGSSAPHPASAARMRAQLRVPLWNEVRSYFSFGECTRSSSSAKPTMMVSMPSTRLKSPTIGIEPPSPTVTAVLPHSAFSAARALTSAGLSNGSWIAGARP